NNAAIPNPSNNLGINEEQFEKLMRVNVEAPFFITKQAAEQMNDGGRIINISSKASKTPHPQSGVYAMTKAALDTFTVQMASKLGPRKITVNAIAPGPILTDMNREQFANEEIRKRVESWAAMKGIGDPDDIAGTVAFLVSPDAGWITGQWIEISGGLGI
ncbi:MAG TPA: SDR family oxidoreductase, partial [Balneolales bacterium]|nr:SDR family oxidoreductase [Balneolales bacterium]